MTATDGMTLVGGAWQAGVHERGAVEVVATPERLSINLRKQLMIYSGSEAGLKTAGPGQGEGRLIYLIIQPVMTLQRLEVHFCQHKPAA